MNSRENLIKQLKKINEWDVVVVGGGATGLGIAMDAATRGLKILLVEQADFAKGTSSKATKLVHGGVRYLAQGDISLVREACRERGLLLKNAPHLTKNESFIIPVYSYFDSLKYTLGLKLYDLLAGKLSLGKSKFINKSKTINYLPDIKEKDLKGGVLYHDGQFDDTRLAINIAQTAVEHGACVLNYMKVSGLLKDENNKIAGVKLIDGITGQTYEAKGTIVINATGVYVDNILQMDNPKAAHSVKPSRGIHLTLSRDFFRGKNALMIPATSDGRVLFAVPWHNKLIVGTTDTLSDKPELEPKAHDDEIDFIINTFGKYAIKKPQRSDILSVFAGLRPLAAPKEGEMKTKEISRSHKITVSSSNLITIIGGKWTTFRKMAEDTLDKAVETGKLKAGKCITESLPIHGFAEKSETQQDEELCDYYGSDLLKIKELYNTDESMKELLVAGYPFTKAMVVWAVRNEYALHIEDFLARRCRLLFLDTKAAVRTAPKVAEIMAEELNRNQDWIQNEINNFMELSKIYTVNM